MSKGLKYIKEAKKKIDVQDYIGAIEDLDVAVMLDSNNFQAWLMQGLCHEKMENYDKAKESYLFAYDLKKEDFTVNKQLYQLYNTLEEYEEASLYIENICTVLSQNKDKIQLYEQYTLKQIEIYENNQDQDKCYNLLVQIVERQDVSDNIKINAAKSYFKLACDSITLQEETFSLLANNFGQTQEIEILDEILKQIMDYIHHKWKISECTDAMFNYFYKLETSQVALEYQFHYYLYHANKDVKICEQIAKKALQFLCENEYQEQYGNLYENSKQYVNYRNQDQDQDYVKMVSQKCKVYLNVYMAFLHSDNSDKNTVSLAKQLIKEQNIDNLDLGDFRDHTSPYKNFIMMYVYHIIVEIREQNQMKAKQYLDQFYEQISLYKESADIGFLEDLHTKLGLQVFDDIDSLLQAKVICKIRLNQNFENLEMLKCYYDCMEKLIRNFQHYDPEIPLPSIIKQILQIEPDNKFFQGENIWLQFSELNSEQQSQQVENTIEQLQNLIKDEQTQKHVKGKTLKRIGTLMFTFEKFQDISEVEKVWLQSKEENDQDYQIYQCLGILYEKMGDNQKSLDSFTHSFVTFQYDIQVNKNVYYLLEATNQSADALDYIERIREAFSKIFWVNYVLGLSYANLQNFEEGEKYLSKAILLFQQDEQRTIKSYYEQTIEQLFSQYSLVYKLDQNDVKFLNDYPIFSDNYWLKKAEVLANNFCKKDSKRKLYKLYIQQSQATKMRGMIGSALRSIQEASFILTEAFFKENESKNVLERIKNPTHQLGQKMHVTCQHFTKAFLKQAPMTKGFLDIENYDEQAVLLNFEYATVLFYSQNYHDSLQKLRIALYLGINLVEQCHQKVDQTQMNNQLQLIEQIYNRILGLIYEIGTKIVLQTMNMQNKSQALCIYEQLKPIEEPICDNFVDYVLLSEFFLTGYLIKSDENDIIFCLAYLEGALQFLQIDENELNLEEKNLEKINEMLNNYSDTQIRSIQALFVDLIFANYKMFQINNEQKRFDKAMELSKIGMILFEDSPIFYNYYAIISTDINQKIGSLLKSIQIETQNCIAIDNLAELYFQNGLYQESAKLYLKSMEINPGNTKAYTGIMIITIIYGMNYLRVYNKEYQNNQKKYGYYKTQLDFFFNKCRSYLQFILEFESNDTTVLIDSILEFMEYNNVLNTRQDVLQLPYSIKDNQNNSQLLINILNFQLISKPYNTKKDKESLKLIFNNELKDILKLEECDKKMIEQYFNFEEINKDQLQGLSKIFFEKLKMENKQICDQIYNTKNVNSTQTFYEDLTITQDHYPLICKFVNHLENIITFLNICMLNQEKSHILDVKAFFDNISNTYSDILFENAQRFIDMYSLQNSLAEYYYHYVCMIFDDDHREIKQSLLLLSNSRQQSLKQPSWVFWQLNSNLDDTEYLNMGDYQYLLGVHAQKKQDQKLVKKKLFNAVLYAPDIPVYKDAYNSYQISIERKNILLPVNNYYCANDSQYEKQTLSMINCEDFTLQQKIKWLSKAVIYLNKPNIWYLWCHYSFEDVAKHNKAFYFYTFQILKCNVVEKLKGDKRFEDGILTRSLKLITEIYWKFKLEYPDQETQKQEQIQKYLKENHQYVHEFDRFEQNVLIYLNKNGADLDALRIQIAQNQDYTVLKLLFEICRKMFTISKGSDLLNLLKELKELIINYEESIKTPKGLKKLLSMVQYVDAYIYLIAISEMFDADSDVDQVEILEILQEASENCLGYQDNSINMIFIYMQNCYQNENMEMLDQTLEAFSRFAGSITSRKDNLINGYFDILYKYHQVVEANTSITETVDELDQYFECLQEEYYYDLNSSLKSLLYYLKGVVKLKQAETVPNSDKMSLMQNFKLAAFYRPDFGKQILKNFI